MQIVASKLFNDERIWLKIISPARSCLHYSGQACGMPSLQPPPPHKHVLGLELPSTQTHTHMTLERTQLSANVFTQHFTCRFTGLPSRRHATGNRAGPGERNKGRRPCAGDGDAGSYSPPTGALHFLCVFRRHPRGHRAV